MTDHSPSRESSPAVSVKVLGELLARLEAATGPDRELDFELHISLIEDAVWPVTDRRGRVTNPNSRMSDYLATYRDVINADDQDFDFPRYTASLDAALGLVERTLPNWLWKVACAGDDRPERFDALLMAPHIAARDIYGEGKTPALALLTAMIRALLANTSPSQAIGEG